ncbi:MAG: MFS transporter [Candidatus Limnocylindria bacterium]
MRDGSVVAAPAIGRPTLVLPFWHLFALSIYWLGMNLIWGGLDLILQIRMDDLVGVAQAGRGIALITILGAITAMIVQPTFGAISDFTVSRWGRRKPYILLGTALDLVFLYGLASADTFLTVVAFFVMLQFSSNLAQGPFQGYVPDLVPARQVGLASALMGVMIVLGRVFGFFAASVIGLIFGDIFLATISLGLVELITAIATLRWVDEGRGAPPRARTWMAIAASAWGRDLLQHRSYLWLLASRLFFLMATAMLTSLIFFYLRRSHGLTEEEAGFWVLLATGAIAVTTGLSTIPAAHASDRLGRKPLIYAACLLGAVGMTGVALAPAMPVALAFVVVFGMGAGAFLAVDWALMTDIIPKATTGRFMGISNVFSAAAGPFALAVGGPTMDLVGAIDLASGPRAAFLIAVLFFGAAALLLRPVDPRRRED